MDPKEMTEMPEEQSGMNLTNDQTETEDEAFLESLDQGASEQIETETTEEEI